MYDVYTNISLFTILIYSFMEIRSTILYNYLDYLLVCLFMEKIEKNKLGQFLGW